MKPLATIVFAASLLFTSINKTSAENHTFRVASPERPKDAPKVVYLFDGKKNHRIKLPGMNLSPVIRLPKGGQTIVLSPEKITEPDAITEDLPVLKIPKGVADFYVLITADPKNKQFPVRMRLIDAGGGKLKAGETLWVNLTPHAITAKLGGNEVKINPQTQIGSQAPFAKSGYYNVEFTYQVNGKGASAPITEQQWWHDAKSKHLGFITNTGGRLPKVNFFRDFRSGKR
ncbi:MAG: hypothetical protein AB8F34_01275 [Akkermansiaceae bacterium]